MTPTPLDQAESTRLRLTFLALLIVSLFVLLVARLWFLQVMAGARYAEAAETNAVRVVPIEAPRGQILAADGVTPLVENRYAMVVSVQPAEMGERRDDVLADLADLLGLELAEIEQRIAGSRAPALRPKPIAVDVPADIAFYIHENGSTRYPGVYAENLPQRTYPQGDLAAHLVGYVGEISAEQLGDAAYEGYVSGDVIGQAGLERAHEAILRGIDGERRLQVDRNNEVVGELPDTLPQPGADVVTSIDLDAQRLVEQALADGIAAARQTRDSSESEGRGGFFAAPAGAAVVLDPTDGQVVAMASFPAYDPTRFISGIDQAYWSYLQDPEAHEPLLNRAVQAAYPPGSVFKVVSASAALNTGLATQTSELPCPGSWRWEEQVFNNWTTQDMGAMNLSQALTHSCDTVFYELAKAMWTGENAAVNAGQEPAEVLGDEARMWGFGSRLGIDLPGERGGAVPGRQWRREYWENARDEYCSKAQTLEQGSKPQLINADLCENGARWRGGDAVNMSIGQGDLQVTPLQVATAFGALASGGTVWRPHLAREIVRPDGSRQEIAAEAVSTLATAPANLAYIEGGLEGVMRAGTAESVFGDLGLPVAGKTGTAEFGVRQPFAWFAGYTTEPVEGAEYVVVTMIEEGGGGSQTAAPVVRNILEGLFGLEQTPIRVGQATD